MPEAPVRRRRKLAAILMADVSGFSRMMGGDEDRTITLIQAFHERVAELVDRFEGRVVDTAGDSVFGEFDSVVNAVRCAVEIQESQVERGEAEGEGEPLITRIGVHLGDVVVEDDRVYGDGVNIAARLESIAEPGGICISEAVYQQIHSKLDLEFDELGPQRLKNIEQPVRLYALPPPRSLVVPEPGQDDWAPVPVDSEWTWTEELARPGSLIQLATAIGLLGSPVFIPSAGVLPTAGGVVAATALGRVVSLLAGIPGRGATLVLLGGAIAMGALFTRWSAAMNYAFVLAGLVTVAWGMGLLLLRAHPRSR